MSEYREKLQKMMLRAARPESAPYQRFYAVCEYAAYAAFLAGWALCIVCHI